VVVVYHNVTPAEHFLGFHHHLARLCHHGRRELAAFAPRAELALGDSEYNRRELAAAGYARTGVLPIVLDLAAYRGRPSPVIGGRYGDGRRNVLFVGRIIPNKKLDDVVRCFALYQRHLEPASRLLLVGDHRGHERYYARLLELVEALRVRDVVFAGHVDQDELIAYYRAADAFLCLSEHEGYCVPLVEAMLFGVPVVAYDAGAVRDTLRGGGVLLTDKRPELVAELLAAASADAGFRRAVLATQQRAVDELRATDFGALLRGALAPVLG
jgi:glycosyltransferase involved in cell wall biosynthesis